MKFKMLKCILVSLMILLCIQLIPKALMAQYWTALPPYNVLWPLWSPALSPPSPLTGLPTPLLTSLTSNTILPVQPSLVWDPSLSYYYLLYNYFPAPGTTQVMYYDPLKAGLINPFSSWPPSDLLSTTGIPNPLTLPINYQSLLSFDPALWLNNWVPLSNIAWQNLFGVNPNLLLASALYPPNYVYTATYLPAATTTVTTPVPGAPGGAIPVI